MLTHHASHAPTKMKKRPLFVSTTPKGSSRVIMGGRAALTKPECTCQRLNERKG
jgi:hypothetical protein